MRYHEQVQYVTDAQTRNWAPQADTQTVGSRDQLGMFGQSLEQDVKFQTDIEGDGRL